MVAADPSEMLVNPKEGRDVARLLRVDQVVAMLDVLGINPEAEEWAGSDTRGGSDLALARVVEAIIALRATARADKDFAQSDVLRDLLAHSGIALDDTPDGATWRIDG
jgi:cysteinyl-tRNA synthetase